MDKRNEPTPTQRTCMRYRGRPIEQMSREELLEALCQMARLLDDTYRRTAAQFKDIEALLGD